MNIQRIGLSFIFAHSLFGMEESKALKKAVTSPVDWVNLNSWRDAASFAGRVVAFKRALKDDVNAYEFSLESDCSVRYGLISHDAYSWLGNDPGKGHRMQRVFKNNLFTGGIGINACNLTDPLIRREKICVRLLTFNEIEQIQEAFQSNKASFEQIGPNNETYMYSLLLKLGNLNMQERKCYVHKNSKLVDIWHKCTLFAKCTDSNHPHPLTYLPREIKAYICAFIRDPETHDLDATLTIDQGSI